MPNNQPQPTPSEQIRRELYSSFDDNEFFEAMEVAEAYKNGRISDEEYQKLLYISKTRELLKGGDA